MDIGGLAKEPGWLLSLSLDLPTEQPLHVPSWFRPQQPGKRVARGSALSASPAASADAEGATAGLT